MALQSLPGGLSVDIGPGAAIQPTTSPNMSSVTVDAANEAVIFIGQVWWTGGGTKTVDTSGSSSIGWRSSSLTFANGGTTVNVGIAGVDTANGPPGRASHASDVISFDVVASFTGGGGGITGSAWQTSVPTSGTKTIASGDLVAVAVQMTARGGTDVVRPQHTGVTVSAHSPQVTTFTGGSYATNNGLPNVILTASDGTLGWMLGGEVANLISQRTWNSGGATAEYGQLYLLPFPVTVLGIFGYVDPDANFDVVLYSDPLGTPVAERTASVDANTTSTASAARFKLYFGSGYDVPAFTAFGTVYKPGGSNITAFYKTLASASHRIADPFGTSGYGISRASGAFADANSSLDHYYIGPIVRAFEHGVWPSGHLGV